jgi:hypothetical protein
VTAGETIILFFCSFYCLSGKIAVSLLPNTKLFRHGVNSIPPWSKFHSAMVEQNFLHGGTKFTPWRNNLIEETAFSLCHREKGC